MYSHGPRHSDADHDRAMIALKRSETDLDIFARTVYAPAVVVYAGINRDTVISGIEKSILDQYIVQDF